MGSNAALALDGPLASGGSATLDPSKQVTITSAGNDAAVSFLITGTGPDGTVQTETVTGANAGAAQSTKFFSSVTSIVAVGDPAGTVKAGVGANQGPPSSAAPAGASGDASLSAAAEVGSNAALALDGPLASGGSAAFDPSKQVTLTSAGNDAAVFFLSARCRRGPCR